MVLAFFAVSARQTTVSLTLNHLAYDLMVELDSRLQHASGHVLLVYVDPDVDGNPARYWQLIRQLRQLGASGLGILDLDIRQWQPGQCARLAQWKGLVVGHVDGMDENLPTDLTRSSIDLPSEHDGVYRRYAGRVASLRRSSFAVDVAENFGTEAQIPSANFGVRFQGAAESLPHVTAEQVLQGQDTGGVSTRSNRATGPAAAAVVGGSRDAHDERSANVGPGIPRTRADYDLDAAHRSDFRSMAVLDVHVGRASISGSDSPFGIGSGDPSVCRWLDVAGFRGLGGILARGDLDALGFNRFDRNLRWSLGI